MLIQKIVRLILFNSEKEGACNGQIVQNSTNTSSYKTQQQHIKSSVQHFVNLTQLLSKSVIISGKISANGKDYL